MMVPSSSSLCVEEKASSPRTKSAVKVDEREIEQMFSPDALRWSNISWPIVGWMTLMHAGAVAAFFFFSWQAVLVTVVLHWLTASIGICLGYHRYLAHKGFKLTRPAQFFVYLCGCLSVEGSPLTWAATHRVHHAKSDKPGDPHSPGDGNWWSHMLWLFVGRTREQEQRLFQKYVPDLMNDPMLRFFDRTFVLWTLVLAAGLYALGGISMVLWGVCFRMTLVYHGTWFVNSVTHLWGYRSYATTDDSKNLWWVALLAYGEGWHNNHHAYPRLARAGHRWWEVDMTFWAIRVLQMLGMAYDVNDRIPQRSSNAQGRVRIAQEPADRHGELAPHDRIHEEEPETEPLLV